MKNDRLFQILYILLAKQSLTAPELAEILEVSTRTIYRDVETLSQAGVPIFAASGKGGGISLVSGYTFDRSLLSDEEQNQILFALQSLKATGNLGAEALLRKLGGVFKKGFTNWIEVDFSRWGHRQTDQNKFELLKRSIIERIVLNIHYCGQSGERTVRRVEPVKLIFKDKSWYLSAFCQRAKDFRLFKVNRIISADLTRDFFETHTVTPPPLDLTDIPDEMEFIEIKLCFERTVGYRVFDEFDISDIEIQTDGSLIVTTWMPDDNWLYTYLLTFGMEVDIISPCHVREVIADMAGKISEKNKNKINQ